MKIIDLSQRIYDNMPVHPYDNDAHIIRNKSISKDKYTNTQVDFGMHVGTHIDAPLHLIEHGKSLSQYNLEHFVGNGCLIDVRGESIISMKDEYLRVVKKDDIVLLYTGYDECFTSAEYFSEKAPVISKELAEFFVEQGVKMVGMDLSSPDKYPFDIHKILLSNDVLIIENMCNLGSLIDVECFNVQAFPLNIDAEASITRAVAIID